MEIVNITLDSVGSTQAFAKENAHTYAKDKITCVSTKEQTKGVGRFHRPWLSPKGNIFATFYFTLPKDSLHLTSLAQIMTLSFAEVLCNNNLAPKIKWPNDVLLNNHKCAGTLCEITFNKDHVDVFLGIGIDVNMSKEECAQIDKPATSLKVETGKDWSEEEILKALQEQFAKDLTLFKEKGFDPFHSKFENLMAYIGEEITCFDGEKEYSGICHSLNSEGQLNLCIDGDMRTIFSGDIENK